MAGKNKFNRRKREDRRHGAMKVNKAEERRGPEDTLLLETYLDHHENGPDSVLVVLDGKTMERAQTFQRALRIARGVPQFSEARQLPDDDRYVQFFFKLEPELVTAPDGRPRRLELNEVLANAKPKAAMAYEGPLQTIEQDALILALLYYNDFDGPVPNIQEDDEDPAEFEEMFGLPAPLPRNMASGIEKKLNYIKELTLTDTDFAAALTEAVQSAIKRVELDAKESEEANEDGFHGE